MRIRKRIVILRLVGQRIAVPGHVTTASPVMQRKPRAIREPLKNLLGQIVEVRGHVDQIKQQPGFLDLLIINAKVSHLEEDKTLLQCSQWSVDHLWLKQELVDDQIVSAEPLKRYDPLFAQGTPYRYTRADGSVDYGVKVWPQLTNAIAANLYRGIQFGENWEKRVTFLEKIVNDASNNRLRLNGTQQTHNEGVAEMKKWLREARINAAAVAKAPKANKPKAPTFAKLLRDS